MHRRGPRPFPVVLLHWEGNRSVVVRAGGQLMEYRVLGPLEALDSEGPLPLGGAKQRALLALLLLNANHVVSRERLIDELWGENPPETAVTSVQVYVSRLRKLLPDGSLVTRPPGYALEVEPENVDLIRFERLVKDGRAALAAGDPVSAAETIRAAIALWRGPALTEFATEPFAQIEGGRLDDLRVAALEERIDADLQLGRHAELTGELEVLITSHPHRERLRAQLMLALYRAGRQSEALDVYRNLRATLDEIGIAPGENLQRLERQILNHDREIDAPALPIAEATAPAKPLERQRVTVLFAALDATNEVEDDPVQTAAFFDRLHDEATAEIEAAGGSVEKGLVGALLATFARDEHAAHAANAALDAATTDADVRRGAVPTDRARDRRRHRRPRLARDGHSGCGVGAARRPCATRRHRRRPPRRAGARGGIRATRARACTRA